MISAEVTLSDVQPASFTEGMASGSTEVFSERQIAVPVTNSHDVHGFPCLEIECGSKVPAIYSDVAFGSKAPAMYSDMAFGSKASAMYSSTIFGSKMPAMYVDTIFGSKAPFMYSETVIGSNSESSVPAPGAGGWVPKE